MAVVATHNEFTLTWTPPVEATCEPIADEYKINRVKTMSKDVDTENDDGVQTHEKEANAQTAPFCLTTEEQQDLDYMSVSEYVWPAQTRKRQRMSEDERKARHREVQRQFMQRKQVKLDDMRRMVVVLEKRYQILQLNQERARLEQENTVLQQQVRDNPPPAPTVPQQADSEDAPPTITLPWDDILEAVSEAKV